MTASTTATEDLDAFAADWQDWHRQQETRLADPHGFLAVTSLHWLTATPQRFPDAPGAWSTGPDGVTVALDDGDELVVEGTPARGRHSFGVIPERGSVNAVWGEAVVEVAKRGGHDIVRPRHPNNPLRTAFHGTPTYPPHPRWAVTGRYVPFEEPRPTTVGAAVEGLEHVYDAPGRIEFDLDGQPTDVFAEIDSGAALAIVRSEHEGYSASHSAPRPSPLGWWAPAWLRSAPRSTGTTGTDASRSAVIPGRLPTPRLRIDTISVGWNTAHLAHWINLGERSAAPRRPDRVRPGRLP